MNPVHLAARQSSRNKGEAIMDAAVSKAIAQNATRSVQAFVLAIATETVQFAPACAKFLIKRQTTPLRADYPWLVKALRRTVARRLWWNLVQANYCHSFRTNPPA